MECIDHRIEIDNNTFQPFLYVTIKLPADALYHAKVDLLTQYSSDEEECLAELYTLYGMRFVELVSEALHTSLKGNSTYNTVTLP